MCTALPDEKTRRERELTSASAATYAQRAQRGARKLWPRQPAIDPA
jgi:hypothetical protein